MKIMIGYCGLDCKKCDAYLATVNDDDALRRKTAELWSKLNNTQITPEMICCTGCRTDGVKTYFCSDLCEIRKCAVDKKIETCGECRNMDDCRTVSEIHKQNEQALKNLKK